jgi:pheromone shutdown protein TraB
MQATLFEASRLRRQKNEAESGVSKALDFTQTKAVLNAGAEEVEKAVEKALKFYFGYMGQDVEVEYSIERNFEVSQLDEELKILAQVLSLGLGGIAETAAKRQFRDKYITMSDQDKMMSDQELMQGDSEAFEINSGDNEGDNE